MQIRKVIASNRINGILVGVVVSGLALLVSIYYPQNNQVLADERARVALESVLGAGADSVETMTTRMLTVKDWDTLIVFAPYRDAVEFSDAGIKNESICNHLAETSRNTEDWRVAALRSDGRLICTLVLQRRFIHRPNKSVMVIARNSVR